MILEGLKILKITSNHILVRSGIGERRVSVWKSGIIENRIVLKTGTESLCPPLFRTWILIKIKADLFEFRSRTARTNYFLDGSSMRSPRSAHFSKTKKKFVKIFWPHLEVFFTFPPFPDSPTEINVFKSECRKILPDEFFFHFVPQFPNAFKTLQSLVDSIMTHPKLKSITQGRIGRVRGRDRDPGFGIVN